MASYRTDNPDPFYLWGSITEMIDSVEKGSEGLPKQVILKGVVSADVVDADGETVNQDGIDWNVFRERGRLTDGHPYRRDRVVGEPIKGGLSRSLIDGVPATILKARLYMHLPLARKLYEQHKGMLDSGATNGLGFSIEGHALLRTQHGRRIEKSIVTSVAIDAMPKNPFSYLEPIAASMASMFRSTLMGEEVHAHQLAAGAMRAAFPKDLRARVDLIKGLGDEDLMVARLLQKNPRLTGREARTLVQLHRKIRRS